MRDGTRVRGELIAVRNGTIEFEERRGFGGGRTLRVNRDEVARIEFDESTSSVGDASPGGRPGGMRERTVNVSANQAVERHRHRRALGADAVFRVDRRGHLGAEPPRWPGRREQLAVEPESPDAESSGARR